MTNEPHADYKNLAIDWLWRTGTSVGRTIYAMPPGSSHRDGEVLIGMMDTPELARETVNAHNERTYTRDSERSHDFE